MASPDRRRQRHPYSQDARTPSVGRWTDEYGRKGPRGALYIHY